MGVCASNAIHAINDWDVVFSRDPNDDYLALATSFTQMWVLLANEVIDPNERKTASMVLATKIAKKKLLPLACQETLDGHGISLRFTDEDEDLGDLVSTKNRTGIEGLISGVAFKKLSQLPMEEKERLSFFPSVEQGVASGDAVVGRVLPATSVSWEEFESDEAFSLIAFNGLGMLCLTGMPAQPTQKHAAVQGAVCQIDLSLLAGYAVREPFERYGCIAYFSEDRRPLAVYHCAQDRLVTPEDKDWSHCKYLFRSSLTAMVTVRDHLIHVHWQISNTLMLASRQSFPADHPLRRLLKPHTYLSTNVNWASTEVLLPINSLAYRVFAVDKADWKRLIEDCIKTCKFETFPEQMRRKNLPESIAAAFPLQQDGVALWDVIRRYVAAYVGVFYANDAAVREDECVQQYWAHYESAACWVRYGLPELGLSGLIDQLTHSIFWVTAGHELVGSIVQYFKSPAGLGSKVVAGKSEADVDSHLLALTLLALTGFNMPMLIDDWSHIHLHAGLTEKQTGALKGVLSDFQFDLKTLSAGIDKLNDEAAVDNTAAGTRRKKFDSFNPKFLECSVSI